MASALGAELLRIEVLHMSQVFADNVRVAKIAPEAEVSEGQRDRMTRLVMVRHQVRLDVARAADLLALEANPVFLSVATIFARRVDCDVFEVLNRSYMVFVAMWAFLDWLNGKHAHDRT